MVSRREREIEEMKELILSAATEIVKADGIDNLSIRKLAGKIEYSPSIIYHYFKDKDDILNNIMQRGYNKIITAISSVNMEGNSPYELLKGMTRNYIEAALKMPDEFMSAQLNISELALKHTSTLFKGASREKPALAALYRCLKEIYKEKEDDDSLIELTAQIIAVSTLGFTIKLIIEKDIGEEQRTCLIDFFVNDTVLKIAGVSNQKI
jgi:AcrR family transcriptional regulator